MNANKVATILFSMVLRCKKGKSSRMGKALLSKGIWIFELQVTLGGFICTRVSNDTGQSCLAEQRNRKFFILYKETMGQAQNLVMGRAGMEF